MSEPDPEQLAVMRQGAALCRHDLRFLVRATGRDVVTWLDRLASNPVANMPPASTVTATLMDGKGRMQADLRIISPAEPAAGLVLELPTSHRERLLRLLDMYIIKDDVVLTDLSGSRAFLSVLGPDAAVALQDAGLPCCPGPGEVVCPDDETMVLESRLAGLAGFDLAVARNGDVVERLLSAGAAEVGLPALEVVRLEHGVPWFGPDLSAGVIPLEALLDDHVSITKGCYPGQEVVARIQNLGQVSRKLVRLEHGGRAVLEPGAELTGTGDFAGKSAGTLTSAAYDGSSDVTRALGLVRRAHWKQGTRLVAGEVQLTVASLSGD